MPLDLGLRRRGRQGQVPVTPQESINSSTPPTPTENIQKSRKREFIWNSVASAFGPTSERRRPTRAPTPSTSHSPANFSENASRGSLKLGDWLQQEASDLWTRAYNELPIEYKQDLECESNTGSDKPGGLDALKQLLERAIKAREENIASQWKLEWGGKEINVREKTESLVGWITKFKDVVDIAVQYDPVHAALPWAGVRFILILVTGKQQNLQHAIVAMERITFLVGRCTIYEKLYLIECHIPDIAKTPTHELRQALVFLYTAILRALSRCIGVFKGNFLDNLGAIFAEITALDAPESAVNSTVQALETCYNSYTRTSNQVFFDKLMILLQDFSSVVTRVERIDENVTTVYEKIQETERIAILRWFSVIPYKGHHDLASETRVAGTGQWLFQRKEFKHWQQSEKSEVLWLHGIPGAGKTKLVSATVDHLEQICQRRVVYFYCKRDEEVRRDRHIILLSLIKQLACPPNEAVIYTEALQAYNKEQKDPSARKNLPPDACLKLLPILLQYHENAVIVIDALDECSKESCSLILSDLLSILKKSKCPIKALISSRHSLEIEDRLCNFPNVSIEARDNAEDIENYVKTELTRRIENRELLRGRISVKLRQRIEEVLQRDANGMFLWVDYQIRELCSLSLERDIHARLGKLPKNLTGVYDEIMNAIMQQEGSSSQIATRALKWMVVSQGPLKPDELIAAADLDPTVVVETTALVPELTLDIDLLIKFCGGLLLRDKQLDVIRFSHLSVQEYLETESLNKNWDIIDAQRLVMEACLWALHAPESAPLYSYSARYWFRHCRSYQDLVVQAAASNKPSKHTLDVPSLRNFLHSFDQPTTSYQRWTRFVSSAYTFGGQTAEVTKYEFKFLKSLPVYPAFAAAFGGLGELVSWLWLAEGVDMNVTDIEGRQLLQYAIISGNVELVERVITMGADILAKPPKGTALAAATANFGNLKILSLLLDRGADINAPDTDVDFRTALNVAVWEGNREMTSLLLERGADIHLICDEYRYGTTLGSAASGGDMELVSMMLDRGAEINAIGGDYVTALGCAAWEGNIAVVSLLLERGADINRIGGEYGFGTALGCAAVRGDVEFVSMMLDRGAEINAIGGENGTPLGCAAWAGNIAVAALLLERGADINLVGGTYGTALGCACACPRGDDDLNACLEAASFLVQRGASVNISAGLYGSALGVSAYYGCIEITRFLMQHGARLDLTDDDGMNARALAVQAGYLDTVQFLDSWDGGSGSS